ncbi:MAG TPA: cytochrome c-type biogenesis CcmF C-terminal domain-containing protein, partial [Thermoanaerobaculia bacterium]|nr:cytochrome c-type biogenesis CcmF C-terminal domain-containing protein [Thermoanaerobaculia bacterium]
FSVSYVAHVGSLQVPLWVTIVSLWSSLEGSILFWGFVLAINIAVATRLTRKDEDAVPYAIATWMACAAFFSFLIAGPANPFLTVSPAPLDGPGPNPLLQNHVLMAAHPPLLYLGYVGMTIPFGFATAALLRGRLSKSLFRPMRRSLLLSWIFLTLAIMLGGWWAYEVLGWGGYWAWDPVENASLLPWLTATAALHSAIVTERRRILKGWTVTLVQASFLLTILGTFMTRSGVFNSVHSFTQSAIGPTILLFLCASLIGSVALLSLRIDALESEGKIDGAVSREGAFLVNNLLFVLLTFTVLIGTVFPLVVEAINGRQMSVGRPYFDSIVVPLGTTLLFLLGVGPALPWGRASREAVRRTLLPPLFGGAALCAAGLLAGIRNPWAVGTCFLGGYALQVTMSNGFKGNTTRTPPLRRIGAYLIHAGAIVTILAIAISSTQKVQREVTLQTGESASIGSYAVTFAGAELRREPHREATVARVEVARDGRRVATLEPRMNQYEMMREPIGTPDVLSTLTGDLYVSIANLGNTQATLLLIINPMVSWIWVAVVVMALGGAVALVPSRWIRWRREVEAEVVAPEAEARLHLMSS